MSNCPSTSQDASYYGGHCDRGQMDPRSSISSKHAICFREAEDVKCTLEYVKAVGFVVGGSQIHSVYRHDGSVKVYLKDEKLVEQVVNSGVNIRGRHTTVDFADSSATKIRLLNVDSIIPNAMLEQILKPYGVFASKVVSLRLPTTDVEYSHVECGERQVFMRLHPDKTVPSRMPLTYNGVYYSIMTHVKQEDSSPLPLKPPTLTPEDASKCSDPFSFQNSSEEINTSKASSRKRPNNSPKGKSRKDKSQECTPKKTSPSTLKNERRRKDTTKPKIIGGKKLFTKKRFIKKPSLGRNEALEHSHIDDVDVPMCEMPTPRIVDFASLENSNFPIDETGDSNSSIFSGSNDETFLSEEQREAFSAYPEYPFSLQKLEEFLRVVKNNRMPEKIASDMLFENETPDALKELTDQLQNYSKVCSNGSLKSRIPRILFQFNKVLIHTID